MALGQDSAALNTGTNLDGATGIAAGTAELVDPLNLLEAVRVDDKRAVANAAADKVVARVADDETDVVLARKVDTRLDLLAGRGLDHIDTVVA